jgi:hypothetical protein
MQTLNLAYSELVSLLISHIRSSDTAIRRLPKKGGKQTIQAVTRKQVDEVASYVVRCLRGEVRGVFGFAPE